MNVLDIYCDSLQGSVTFDDQIKKQKMTLVSYRVEFTDDEDSLACKYVKFNAEWCNNNSYQSAKNTTSVYDQGFIGLVLPLSGSKVTLQTPMLMIDLGKDIHEGFTYLISGLDTSNFVSLHLVFNYNNGEIV